MRNRCLTGAVLVVSVLLPTGCTSTAGSDKAGAVNHESTVVLRLANTAFALVDVPPVASFVRRVSDLSGGTLRIDVVNDWHHYVPQAEAEVVGAVAADRIDLGWVGSRVFDTLGVPDFAPLSAPMLIDSYPLIDAVLRSDVPEKMLASLTDVGVTGLGLFGDELRFPVGVRHPLRAPADWRGLSIGTTTSRIQGAAYRALDATPVTAFGPYRTRAVETGQIQGFEFDVIRYDRQGWIESAPFVTSNVPLWPQFDVLVASPDRLAALSPQQREWLEQAAREASQSPAHTAQMRDAVVRHLCAAGAHFVTATAADLAALRSAFAPMYGAMTRDPQESPSLDEIRQLKSSMPHYPALTIPPDCA